MYLIPPMDDEPPPEFVAFVASHLAGLRAEMKRLVGGDAAGDQLHLEVLADVAGHWRRLCWRSRLLRRDMATEYMLHRLAVRTRDWRDDQVYEVDIRVMREPLPFAAPRSTAASLALRKAAVLPGTVRGDLLAVADAGIAWVEAYRRHQWHRVGQLIATGVLLIGGMIQYMSLLAGG
ncbi:MAG TPA: hypothetical protein VGB74_18905 [Actinoplanes sp.]|jgi:hypothetical protein